MFEGDVEGVQRGLPAHGPAGLALAGGVIGRHRDQFRPVQFGGLPVLEADQGTGGHREHRGLEVLHHHRLNPRPSRQLGLRMIAWPPAGAIATFNVVAEVTDRVLTTTGVWYGLVPGVPSA
jgi:hypothetical protein